MTRALLTGHPPLVNEIEASLSRWGVAVECLERDDLDPDREITERHDVVILACGEATDRGLCEWAAALSNRGAPLLLVGGPDGHCHCRAQCRRHVADLGPRAEHLRQAFEICLAHSRCRDRENESLRDVHDYIQFLNHEMRTPLTAARTALQILSQELPRRDVESLRSVVRVALRNVERLSRTLAWSDDYFAGRALGDSPRCCRTALAELVDFGEDDGEEDDRPQVEFAADADAQCAFTDPELVRKVNRQLARALRYFAPGQKLNVRVEMRGGQDAPSDPEGPGCNGEVVLSYRLGAERAAASPCGKVIRTHLATGAEQSRNELTRLIEFTVSREILTGLRARIVIPADHGGAIPVAELILPSLAGSDAQSLDAETCPAGA